MPFRVKHYPLATDESPQAPSNGEDSGDPKVVELSRPGHGINIRSLVEDVALQVSFDKGRTYYTVPAGTVLSLNEVLFNSFAVRSSTGDAIEWCALVKEG